jgi:hypothetical protein
MNFPSLAALTGEAGLKVGKFQSNIAIEQGTHGQEEAALAAPIYLAMLRPAYLSQKLDRPLPTKDAARCAPS